MLPPGADPNGVQASYENGGELRRRFRVRSSDENCCKCARAVNWGRGHLLSDAAITARSADRQDTQDRGVQGAAAEEDRSTVDMVFPRVSLLVARPRMLLQMCSQGM